MAHSEKYFHLNAMRYAIEELWGTKEVNEVNNVP
jgi:hypothetical protein